MKRFYLDPSVFVGFFDEQFHRSTKLLFEYIEKERLKVVYSNLLERELASAPQEIALLALSNFPDVEYKDENDDMLELAKLYIKEGVLTDKDIEVAHHIAFATLSGVSIVVSWDYENTVNMKKILWYNSINLREGHRMIEIYTPMGIVTE